MNELNMKQEKFINRLKIIDYAMPKEALRLRSSLKIISLGNITFLVDCAIFKVCNINSKIPFFTRSTLKNVPHLLSREENLKIT